jgi:hypothetical protein
VVISCGSNEACLEKNDLEGERFNWNVSNNNEEKNGVCSQ